MREAVSDAGCAGSPSVALTAEVTKASGSGSITKFAENKWRIKEAGPGRRRRAGALARWRARISAVIVGAMPLTQVDLACAMPTILCRLLLT